MTWTNDGLPFLVNSLITEYDIKSGNTSIMRTYQLADSDTISKLEKLPKGERVRQVGLMQRDDKEFAKKLEASFNDAVDKFLKANELDVDVDVLAIRRDAIFVVNHPISQTRFADYINFVKKNQYHAALQIGPRLEFYFKNDHSVDIKNFVQEEKDTEHALQKLQPGVISFLQEFVDVAEGCNMNRTKVYQWMREFCTYYKEKSLDIEYYREFTREAMFSVKTDDGITMMDNIPDYMVDDLEISYNYKNIIIPLLQILI